MKIETTVLVTKEWLIKRVNWYAKENDELKKIIKSLGIVICPTCLKIESILSNTDLKLTKSDCCECLATKFLNKKGDKK